MKKYAKRVLNTLVLTPLVAITGFFVIIYSLLESIWHGDLDDETFTQTIDEIFKDIF